MGAAGQACRSKEEVSPLKTQRLTELLLVFIQGASPAEKPNKILDRIIISCDLAYLLASTIAAPTIPIQLLKSIAFFLMKETHAVSSLPRLLDENALGVFYSPSQRACDEVDTDSAKESSNPV